MTWQDLVLSTGSILLALALLPTLFGRRKPAVSTALLTGSVLLVFALTYLTLNLLFASLTTAAAGLEWMIIARQAAQNKV